MGRSSNFVTGLSVLAGIATVIGTGIAIDDHFSPPLKPKVVERVDPGRQAPPSPTPLPKGMSYTQKIARSSDTRYPFDTAITVTTGQERSRASLTFVFSSPYSIVTVANADGSNVAGSVYEISRQAWQLRLDQDFDPEGPLTLHAYAEQPIKVISFTHASW